MFDEAWESHTNKMQAKFTSNPVTSRRSSTPRNNTHHGEARSYEASRDCLVSVDDEFVRNATGRLFTSFFMGDDASYYVCWIQRNEKMRAY